MAHIVQRLRPLAARSKDRLGLVVREQQVRRWLAGTPHPLTGGDGVPVTLFYAPDAGVEPHFAAVCVVARTLKEQGHRVAIVRCYHHFPRCPVMDSYELPYPTPAAARDVACIRCASISIRAAAAYGLDVLDFRSFLTAEVERRVQEALHPLPDDLRMYMYDGIAFGKLCAHDLILATKIADLDQISDQHRRGWIEYIEASIRSYLLVREICRQLPIARFVHYNDYCVMLSGRMAAERCGIPALGLSQASHMNVDRRRLVMVSIPTTVSKLQRLSAWPTWRPYAIDRAVVSASVDDLLVRFGARGRQSHVFSPPKAAGGGDILALLGMAHDRSILVAYTSSLDETIAARMYSEALGLAPPTPPQPFADQIAWLDSLTVYVENSTDLQLVVRIHPREGRRRGGVESQHLQRLRQAFDRSFGHCVFVWPEQQVSSYDLGEVADVVLTSWSSMGLEMARLGVPVLASTHGIGYFPHDDFLEFGATPDTYFQALRALLVRPSSLEMIKRAGRWYNLFHLATSVDVGDVIPTFDHHQLPRFTMPQEAQTIEDVAIRGGDLMEIHLARLRAAQQEGSEDLETAAVQRQLRRLVHYLYTAEDRGESVDLVVTLYQGTQEDSVAHGRNLLTRAGTTVLVIDGAQTNYVSRDSSYVRYSPMCARLGLLCASELYNGPLQAVHPRFSGSLTDPIWHDIAAMS